jgi:phage terminase large subunit
LRVIREVQKSLLQSSKRLIESKIQSLGVGAHFEVLHDRIVTPEEARQRHRGEGELAR